MRRLHAVVPLSCLLSCTPSIAPVDASLPVDDDATTTTRLAAPDPDPSAAERAPPPPTATASVTATATVPATVCPRDHHRQWTCGRPSARTTEQIGKPVAFADCPADGVSIDHRWRMVSFPGGMQPDAARTADFRVRRKDDTGHLVHDVCCYSACVPLEVRAGGDPTPAGQTIAPLCIAALDAAASISSSERADCAAAIKLPGYGSYARFNADSTTRDAPETARRSGFPETKMCCYDGLRPIHVTR
jgi:hypothetical protein